MNRPCDNSVTCFPCTGDYSNPLANLSSEAPDNNIFISIFWPPFGPITPDHWRVNACVGFCESSISQADADDCARRKALECIPVDPNPYCETPPCETFPPPPIYCNQFASFQNGSQCYDLPAGSICALSQVEADALAQSIGNHRVFDPSNSMACSSMPPPPPPVPGDCPVESGTATPASMRIPVDDMMVPVEVSWGILIVPDPETLPRWPDPASGPRYIVDYSDYPPGHYTLQFLGGIWRLRDETDPNEYEYGSGGFDLCDGEFNCQVATSPLASTEFAFIDFYTAIPNEDDQADIDSKTFWSTPAEYRWDIQSQHSNEDTRFFLSTSYEDTGACVDQFTDQSPGGPWIQVTGKLQTLRLFQIDGFRPQPRKVQIQDYNAIKLQFADQSAVALWPGIFDGRTTYDDTELKWDSVAGGNFGGAVIRYISTHPTSANGRGFQMDIYSAGMVLMWRGFKGVGSTGIGRYYKDSTSTPTGPDCLVCEDASDLIWYPGATPPS